MIHQAYSRSSSPQLEKELNVEINPQLSRLASKLQLNLPRDPGLVLALSRQALSLDRSALRILLDRIAKSLFHRSSGEPTPNSQCLIPCHSAMINGQLHDGATNAT